MRAQGGMPGGLIVRVEPKKLTWLASVIAIIATTLPSRALWMTTLPEPAFTLSLKVRTRLAPTATLVELSAGVVVDRVGGVVSGGGAAITSSLAITCNEGPRLVPTLLVLRTL